MRVVLGPILRGAGLTLRPPRPDDLASIPGWFCDGEVTRFAHLRWLRVEDAHGDVPTQAELERWFGQVQADPHLIVWAIEADRQLVGLTAVAGIDRRDRSAATHTVIGDKRFWSRGIGTEVVALRSRYAFETLGLHKLKTGIAADNIAMRKALLRSGYREVGIAREDVIRHGEWQDTWLAEVLRDEWEAAQRGHRSA